MLAWTLFIDRFLQAKTKDPLSLDSGSAMRLDVSFMGIQTAAQTPLPWLRYATIASTIGAAGSREASVGSAAAWIDLQKVSKEDSRSWCGLSNHARGPDPAARPNLS